MTTSNISIDELKRFSILEGLSNEDLARLQPALGQRVLKNGEVLFEEGDDSNEIYLVRNGVVDICKSGRANHECFTIAAVQEGEVFGELAFLDGSPRSALVRASDDTDLVVIEKKTLFQMPFSHLVIANIARASSGKLRDSANSVVKSLEGQLEAARVQNDFGKFFVYILSIMAIGMIANNLMHTYLKSVSPYSTEFFISYTVILLIPSILTVWKLKMPFRSMGVTLSNWKRSLGEGILFSVAAIILFSLAATVAQHFGWLTLKPVNLSTAFHPWYNHPIYFIHSAAQELFRGGFLQTSFERFFNDRTGIRSIGFTALLFGLFHIHFGIVAVAVTFFSSIVFGIIYRRHRNLIGVSIFHYATGAWAFVSGVL